MAELSLADTVSMSPALQKVIKELRHLRDMRAREGIIFDTEQGRMMARTSAHTYNQALKVLGVDDGATADMVAKSRAELKEQRGW